MRLVRLGLVDRAALAAVMTSRHSRGNVHRVLGPGGGRGRVNHARHRTSTRRASALLLAACTAVGAPVAAVVAVAQRRLWEPSRPRLRSNGRVSWCATSSWTAMQDGE